MKEDVLEMDSVSKKVKNFAGKFYDPPPKDEISYDESTDDIEEILDMTESVAVTDIFEKSSEEKTDVLLPGDVPEVKAVKEDKSIPVETIPEKTKVEYTTYTVKKNDSLWGISWRHYMKIKELLFINDLSEGVIIKPGQKLKVKKGKTREMPKRKVSTNTVAKAEEKKEKMGDMGDMGDMGKTNVVTNKVEFIEYTVVKGDTYYNLSKKFNCTVSELEKINENKELLIGMKIKVSR